MPVPDVFWNKFDRTSLKLFVRLVIGNLTLKKLRPLKRFFMLSLTIPVIFLSWIFYAIKTRSGQYASV